MSTKSTLTFITEVESHRASRSFGVLDIELEPQFEKLVAPTHSVADHRTRLENDFFAHAIHEIRTPLASILGNAELLDSTHDNVDDQKIVHTILRNGEHLKALVDGLLDISRIEAGALEIHSAPCALGQLLADIDSLMRIQASETGVGWRIECHEPLPLAICTDALRLRQMLINLVGNAFKFTEQGDVVLAVTTHVSSDTGTEIEFAVRDTGIGMSAEQMARVFAPFAQAESNTAARYGGSGLGLTISNKLARLLGGTLLVESKPGAGSVFRLRFLCEPLGATREVTTTSNALVARGSGIPAVSADALAGRRVLVVDDRDDIRSLVKCILERTGAEVMAVGTGTRALELLRQGLRSDARQFGALVLDLQMPEFDGFDVLATMAADNIDVPVIALTGDSLTVQRERCIIAGCQTVVSKPFTVGDLVGAVLALFAPASPLSSVVPATPSPVRATADRHGSYRSDQIPQSPSAGRDRRR